MSENPGLEVLESFEEHDENGAVAPKVNGGAWPHFTPSGLAVEKSEEQKDGSDKAIVARAREIVLPAFPNPAMSQDEMKATLKAGFDLWRQVSQLPQRTREERIFKRARKKFVGAHVFKMQQGMGITHITAHDHAAMEVAKLTRGEKRELRLEALKAAVEIQGEDSEELFPAPKQLDSVRQRLIDDEFIFDHNPDEPVANADEPGMEDIDNDVPELLTSAILCLRQYEIAHLEHYHFIWPESRKAEVANKIRDGLSHEEMLAIKSELIQLNSPQAYNFKSAAFRNVLSAWQPCRATLTELFTHAKEKITAMKQGAVMSEAVFFADHGLPRETTSASLRFDVLLNELDHHLARVNVNFANYGTPPDASIQLQWFNVQDII